MGKLQQLPDLWVDGRRDLLGGLAYANYDIDAVNYWRQKVPAVTRLSMESSDDLCRRRLGNSSKRRKSPAACGATDGTTLPARPYKVVPVGQSAPVGPNGQFQQLIYNNFLQQGSLTPGGVSARWIPFVDAGVSTELERIYDVDWKYIDKLKHTVEPFVDYDYVPDISQSAVPLFDERDRINARSLVDYGFTSRLYAKMNPSADTPEVSENADAQNGAVRSADSGQDQVLGGPDGVGVFGSTGSESHAASGDTTRELVSMTLEQAYDTTYAVQLRPGRYACSMEAWPVSTCSRLRWCRSGSVKFAFDPRSNPGPPAWPASR